MDLHKYNPLGDEMPTYLINDMRTYTIEADSEEEAEELFMEHGEDVAEFEDQEWFVVGEV